MKAMIFAAGMGSRLRPITDNCPKALVEVHDITMLDRAINNVRKAGADEIVVNVHHHADKIINYLSNQRDVIISDERAQLLDTGGGLLAAKDRLCDTDVIIIYNADILTDIDLSRMVDIHMKNKSVSTLLIDKNRDSSRKLFFDNNQRMRGWENLKTGEIRPKNTDIAGCWSGAFGGIHVVNTSIFKSLDDYAESNGKVFSITAFYIDYCNEININAFVPECQYQWYDIGTIEKLEKARKNFLENSVH